MDRPTASVRVAGAGLFTPGWPSLAAWSAGEPDPEALRGKALALKPMDRRRAGVLARALADASSEAIARADVDPAETALVIGSSIAEAATLIGLLEQIWKRREPVSPAAFMLSVHNAASGQLSIALENRGYATSLAADEDTPAAALLEGIGLVLAEGRSVLVACGDEASPPRLVGEGESWELLASAVVLVPDDAPGATLARVCLTPAGEVTLSGADLDPAVGRNPQAGLADLAVAVHQGREGSLRLDRGSGRGLGARLTAGDRS